MSLSIPFLMHSIFYDVLPELKTVEITDHI